MELQAIQSIQDIQDAAAEGCAKNSFDKPFLPLDVQKQLIQSISRVLQSLDSSRNRHASDPRLIFAQEKAAKIFLTCIFMNLKQEQIQKTISICYKKHITDSELRDGNLSSRLEMNGQFLKNSFIENKCKLLAPVIDAEGKTILTLTSDDVLPFMNTDSSKDRVGAFSKVSQHEIHAAHQKGFPIIVGRLETFFGTSKT